MVQIKSKEKGGKRIIESGDMEHEVYLEKEDLADFLIKLANQMKEQDEVTVETNEWKIPFKFRTPVKLEIDFEGNGEKELEIEVELKSKRDEEAPTIS